MNLIASLCLGLLLLFPILLALALAGYYKASNQRTTP